MGEDRTVCMDKKPNSEVAFRQRHSSIISSCSEDAESESTSAGYPEDDRDQELEYGPGIVDKLRTRFLSITLKQSRGSNMRRSCSMEDLLEQDRPVSEGSLKQGFGTSGGGVSPKAQWGILKRAKSMDTLLLDMEAESNVNQQPKAVHGDVKRLVKRLDPTGRSVPTICDEELPKPDTVKTYKRMFEPAESKRGSHCRRPPVLRASAKSGSATKTVNGVASAKVVAAKSKFSAKQSSPAKAQVPDVVECSKQQKKTLNGYNQAKPFVNGDKPVSVSQERANVNRDKPVFNGVNQDKASVNKPVLNGVNNQDKANVTKPVLNGVNQDKASVNKPVLNGVNQDKANVTKPVLNGVNQDKANVNKPVLNGVSKDKVVVNRDLSQSKPFLNGQNTLLNGDSQPAVCNGKNETKSVSNRSSILCNGKNFEKEVINSISNSSKKEVYFAQVKDIICNRSTSVKNEPVKPVMKDEIASPCKTRVIANYVEGLNSKPKVPPNRPTVLKNLKSNLKPVEPKKVTVNDKKSPPPIKLKNKPVETPKCAIVNGDVHKSNEIVKGEAKVLEENNRKNAERLTSPTPVREDSDLIDFDKEEKIAPNVAVQDHKPPEAEIVKSSTDIKPDSPEIKSGDAPAKPSQPSPKKPQSGGSGSPCAPATSMVFDFRGKDVVPQVAVLPVPFGCKSLHPKKRSLLMDGKDGVSCANGREEDADEESVDYSVPPPCGVIFEGENVKVGRGAILATRNKDLKIKFDDEVDKNTFVYPSETSLLEDADGSTSPAPPEKDALSNGQTPPSKLKSNTSIGSSGAGGLSSYTPSVLRTMDNFQPGMFRPAPASQPPDEEKGRKKEGEEENTELPEKGQEREEEMLKPADPDIISSWSLSAGTSDLLF